MHKIPILERTYFDKARKILGQEMLEKYNEWTIEHSGSIFLVDRMKYFNVNGEEFKLFLKIQEELKERVPSK